MPGGLCLDAPLVVKAAGCEVARYRAHLAEKARQPFAPLLEPAGRLARHFGLKCRLAEVTFLGRGGAPGISNICARYNMRLPRSILRPIETSSRASLAASDIPVPQLQRRQLRALRTSYVQCASKHCKLSENLRPTASLFLCREYCSAQFIGAEAEHDTAMAMKLSQASAKSARRNAVPEHRSLGFSAALSTTSLTAPVLGLSTAAAKR